MDRNREIAGSPVRTAGETWTTITELVAATLDWSPNIDGHDVRRTLNAVGAAGRALVAAGKLNTQPLTLVVASLRLAIRTVSGEDAFRALDDENPNPVPGAATATDWVLHIPRPDGLAALIDEVVQDVSHISLDPPGVKEEARTSHAINLGRLDPNLWS